MAITIDSMAVYYDPAEGPVSPDELMRRSGLADPSKYDLMLEVFGRRDLIMPSPLRKIDTPFSPVHGSTFITARKSATAA